MSEYRVDLDSFAGPLDLLLYLVRKEEVDIYDIPISRITEQYLAYVDMLKRLDVDLAGDFLVMAATLMEIKSAMLLPPAQAVEGDTGEAIDPRAELVRQLLEYKRFKDAANLLESAVEQQQQRFCRPDTLLAAIKGGNEQEYDLDQISIWALLEAFDNIMQSVGQYQSYEHIEDDTPIDLYQIVLLHRLQTEGSMSMDSVFADRTNRLVMIGMFLALLELIRDQLIAVEQPDAHGPIHLRALTSEPAEQAVQKAIYARHLAEEEAEARAVSALKDQTESEASTAPPSDEPAADSDDMDPELAELLDHTAEDVEAMQPQPVPVRPPIPIVELPSRTPAPSPQLSPATAVPPQAGEDPAKPMP